MSALDTLAANKRKSPRHRVLKQGKILLPNNMTVIDCAMRDVSETGARLQCVDTVALPDTFRLVLPMDRTMRDVRVVWRRGEMMGVQFTSEVRKAPLLRW